MISVVVPVKNEWALTHAMLGSLVPGQVDDALVIDNGSSDETVGVIRVMQRGERWRGKLHRKSMPGRTIYEMWNAGFERARKLAGHTVPGQRNPYSHAPFYVLITNNDIVHAPGAAAALATCLRETDAWIAYPDYDAPQHVHSAQHAYRETHGVLSDGGLFGACFMLAGHRIPWRPLVTDLTYEWWYGDNHLAEEIEQHGGKQLRVVGLPVQHVNEATASKIDPGELYRMKYRDRQRWLTRYERKT